MKDSEYWLIVLLASNGFSYRCIEKASGYSRSEIARVLRRENIRLRDYRDGENKIAKQRLGKLR